MPGPVGADDPALEQARLAQLAPRAYADAWLCRIRQVPVPRVRLLTLRRLLSRG